MRFETQSKWQDFLDGFRNVLYILDCYDDGEQWDYYFGYLCYSTHFWW